MFTLKKLNNFISANHPLRVIRTMVNKALAEMGDLFAQRYEDVIKGATDMVLGHLIHILKDMPGKLADLIVLDAKPLSAPADKLMGIHVVETIKAGKTVFNAAKP